MSSDPFPRVRLLTGHTDPSTAYQPTRGPWRGGRFWVDTITAGPERGWRRVGLRVSEPADATHPAGSWGTPRYGVPHRALWMFLDQGGALGFEGVGDGGPSPRHDARLRLIGLVDQLHGRERRHYRRLLDSARRRAPEAWTRWGILVDQFHRHLLETGKPPVEVDGLVDDRGIPVRLGGEVYHLALGLARERLVRRRLAEGQTAVTAPELRHASGNGRLPRGAVGGLVLARLRQHPQVALSAHELGRVLGIAPGSVRASMPALVHAGQVVARGDRAPVRYQAAPTTQPAPVQARRVAREA